ncbi:hypothetical protein [Methanoregula formicica]|uniref:Uncharacterized protein n=1 Tax=Methanoregula formicica (strain DSM 22288 / NBRC 105244 / SMSP) TaxID=593750 RepID=L0HF19_METFS|nr:hypothetical protein [Methanoregula formicica]AGB02615.1 hypothetical protein Metfor_1585 [Methanoregula formicica SMSP]
MMKREEIIKNLSIIFCVIILLIIPWASVIGIQDPVLVGASGEIQRIAFFVIVTSLLVKLVFQIYNKPLMQEMKKEEVREAEQKDRKQLLFKPSTGVIIFFLFLILLSIWGIIYGLFLRKPDEDMFVYIIGSSFLIVLFTWILYATPVFIFAGDSVQIRSHLLYLFGIDRKTIIRYADITSVRPDAEFESDESNTYGYDRKHRIVISMNGTTQKYGLVFFNTDTIVKIYLRFKEKLGDKVRLE